MARWQVQEAKQKFSELLRQAREDGPQIVTRHGEEIAVVIDVQSYRHLRGEDLSFKDFLRSGPAGDELDIRRSAEPTRRVELDV